MTGPEPALCPICGASRWTALPDPGPQSMASDWRVVAEPLGRVVCDGCGVAARRPGPSMATPLGVPLYATGYGLYAHPPGDAREHARQATYAAWIAERAARRPRRVLDVGCGNGSLLRALRSHWPEAELLGCDPSAESVSHGAGPGVRLWQGTAADLPVAIEADLVLSINVVEHTADPRAFVRAVARALATDGQLVLVCPDGARPGVELLFADHLFSFTAAHLAVLLAGAGLRVDSTSVSPPSLGTFQMCVAGRGTASAVGAASAIPEAPRELTAERRAYLEAWRDLDARLTARMPEHVVCFGATEAAGLLRAYAPHVWRRVRACTYDEATAGMFGDTPVVPPAAVRPGDAVLLGVRPADQPHLAERLRARFEHVITWYDLVEAEHDE